LNTITYRFDRKHRKQPLCPCGIRSPRIVRRHLLYLFEKDEVIRLIRAG
jgi:hypothetical protein